MSRRMQDGSPAPGDEETHQDPLGEECSSGRTPEVKKTARRSRSRHRKSRSEAGKSDSKRRAKSAPELPKLKVSFEKLCKAYTKTAPPDCTKLRKRITKIFEEEKKKATRTYSAKFSKHESLLERIQSLEVQRAEDEANLQTFQELKNQVASLQKANKLATKRAEETEDANSTLRKELEDVRGAWFNNTGQKLKSDGNLQKVRGERDGLKNMNLQLRNHAQELAAEVEKARREAREKFDHELGKMQAEHATTVGKLQVALKEAREQRDEALARALRGGPPPPPPADGVPPSTPRQAGANGVMSPNSAQRTDLADQLRHAREAQQTSAHKLSLQLRDLESARASLQEREDECKRLGKITELYNVLTGVSVKKESGLWFDLRAADPTSQDHYFDFRLFMKDESPSLLYEKIEWKSPKQCPDFLDQTGMYFYRSLAPLFMKCMLKPLHEGLELNGAKLNNAGEGARPPAPPSNHREGQPLAGQRESPPAAGPNPAPLQA